MPLDAPVAGVLELSGLAPQLPTTLPSLASRSHRRGRPGRASRPRWQRLPLPGLTSLMTTRANLPRSWPPLELARSWRPFSVVAVSEPRHVAGLAGADLAAVGPHACFSWAS